jgi:carboxylesterase type B
MSQIIHDYLFNCPNRRIAHLLQQRSHAPVYVYEFAHPTRTPGLRACDGLACHTSELPFVFEQLDVISANYSYVTRAQDSVDADAHGTALGGGWKRLLGKEEENADSFVSHAMAAYWTEFAKHGNPNHPRG